MRRTPSIERCRAGPSEGEAENEMALDGELARHASQQLTHAMLTDADVVYTMTPSHAVTTSSASSIWFALWVVFVSRREARRVQW